jgi:hypothetical protein
MRPLIPLGGGSPAQTAKWSKSGDLIPTEAIYPSPLAGESMIMILTRVMPFRCIAHRLFYQALNFHASARPSNLHVAQFSHVKH